MRLRPKPDVRTSASHHAVSIVLKGTLQRAVLESCLERLMQQHAALRMNKRMPLPEIFQVDLGPAVYACGRADAVRGFVECQTEQAFDLQRGPLWSCAVARLDAASSCLVLCAHPSVAEVALLTRWVQELEVSYGAACANEPVLAEHSSLPTQRKTRASSESQDLE